jgi:hypothetical protein
LSSLRTWCSNFLLVGVGFYFLALFLETLFWVFAVLQFLLLFWALLKVGSILYTFFHNTSVFHCCLFFFRFLLYFTQIVLVSYFWARLFIYVPIESFPVSTFATYRNGLYRQTEVLEILEGGPVLNGWGCLRIYYLGFLFTVGLLFGFFVPFIAGKAVWGEVEVVEPFLFASDIIPDLAFMVPVYSSPLILTWEPSLLPSVLFFMSPLVIELPLVLNVGRLGHMGGLFIVGSLDFLPEMRLLSSFITWRLSSVDEYFIAMISDLSRGLQPLRFDMSCSLYNKFLFQYIPHVRECKGNFWFLFIHNRLEEYYGPLNLLNSLEFSLAPKVKDCVRYLRTSELNVVSCHIPSVHYVHRVHSDWNSLKSLVKISCHYSGYEILPLSELNIYLTSPYLWEDSYVGAISDRVRGLILDRESSLSFSERFFLNHSFSNIIQEIKISNYPYGGIIDRSDRLINIMGALGYSDGE